MTAAHVLSFTAAWYLAWILYLGFYSAFALPIILDNVSVSITGQSTSSLSCSTDYPVLNVILYGFEGAFLIGSAILCYATKDVPDAINESKVIALGE